MHRRWSSISQPPPISHRLVSRSVTTTTSWLEFDKKNTWRNQVMNWRLIADSYTSTKAFVATFREHVCRFLRTASGFIESKITDFSFPFEETRRLVSISLSNFLLQVQEYLCVTFKNWDAGQHTPTRSNKINLISREQFLPPNEPNQSDKQACIPRQDLRTSR